MKVANQVSCMSDRQTCSVLRRRNIKLETSACMTRQRHMRFSQIRGTDQKPFRRLHRLISGRFQSHGTSNGLKWSFTTTLAHTMPHPLGRERSQPFPITRSSLLFGRRRQTWPIISRKCSLHNIVCSIDKVQRVHVGLALKICSSGIRHG